MELAGKKSYNKWIKVDDTFEIKVDYPTIEQEVKLQEIMMDDAAETVRMSRYARYLVKCTIKEWRGEAVKDEKLLIIKNEMQDSQWLRLVNDYQQAITLWNLINEEIQFDKVDKKKSN